MSEERISFGTERNRQRYEALTPEQKALFAERLAANRTAEHRAEEQRVRTLVEKEFPPATADNRLMAFLDTLRTERERQGISLEDLAARIDMDVDLLDRIERGRIASPTFNILRAYADALGLDLVPTVASR